eukprot:2708274-Rhodomonas_salina.3
MTLERQTHLRACWRAARTWGCSGHSKHKERTTTWIAISAFNKGHGARMARSDPVLSATLLGCVGCVGCSAVMPDKLSLHSPTRHGDRLACTTSIASLRTDSAPSCSSVHAILNPRTRTWTIVSLDMVVSVDLRSASAAATRSAKA